MKADFGRDEIETFFTDYNGGEKGEREEKFEEQEGIGGFRRKAINPTMSLITSLPESLRNATDAWRRQHAANAATFD